MGLNQPKQILAGPYILSVGREAMRVSKAPRLAALLAIILPACTAETGSAETESETGERIGFCAQSDYPEIFITGFCADIDARLEDGTGQVPFFNFNPNGIEGAQSIGSLNITRMGEGEIYLHVTGEWSLPLVKFYDDGFFWDMEIDSEEIVSEEVEGGTWINAPFFWEGTDGAPNAKGELSIQCGQEEYGVMMDFEQPAPGRMLMPLERADLGIAFDERATSSLWDKALLRDDPDLQLELSNLVVKQVCEEQMRN